jgi:hypothetical protein
MGAGGFRVQLISAGEGIDAVRDAAANTSIQTQATELPKSDQRFGLAEVAAVVAIVHASTEIAGMLARAYSALNKPKKITIKTPKGSVTIDGKAGISAAAILSKMQEAEII